MSLKFRIVFSLACAVLFALVCHAHGEQVRQEVQKAQADQLERFGGEVVSLVVAAEDLETGDVVSEANVETRDWASSLAPGKAFTSLDDVEGREIGVAVAAGVPLTELNFRQNEAEVEVPSGHVALSIPASDKLGIPRSISAGTRLDAYQVDDSGATVIAHDLEALAPLSTQSGTSLKAELTVSALPDEVPALLEASSRGELRLVLPGESVSSQVARSGAPEEVGDADMAAEGASSGGSGGTGVSGEGVRVGEGGAS